MDILVWFFAILGLLVGSFLNVCIYRIPLNKSIVFPSSSCTTCGYSLKWYNNLPVVSWVFQRGKCSKCKSSISLIYPLVELLTSFVFFAIYYKYGLVPKLISMLIFVIFLIVIAFIDYYTMRIPDVIVIPGIVCGLFLNWLSGDYYAPIVGIVMGVGIFWTVSYLFWYATGKIGMGGGDIKLIAMIGAFMGWEQLPLVILLSAASGVFIMMVVRFIKREKLGKFPYGPFLSFAAIIATLWGEFLMVFLYGSV